MGSWRLWRTRTWYKGSRDHLGQQGPLATNPVAEPSQSRHVGDGEISPNAPVSSETPHDSVLANGS